VAALAGRLRGELTLRREALQRPLTQTEQRIELLRRTTREGERALGDLTALLRSEERRLRTSLEGHRARFLAHAGALSHALSTRAGAWGALPRTSYRARLMEEADGLAREAVQRWRAEEQPEVDRLYRAAMARFVAHANGFLEDLGSSAAESSRLLSPVADEAGLGARSRVFFTSLMRLTSPPLPRRLAERIAPGPTARRLILDDARAYLLRLLEVNSSRLQYDLDDRIRESREQLEWALRSRLQAALAAGERALDAAKVAFAEGREAICAELARLDALEHQLAALSPTPTQEPS
jgi:hypothetical protein